MKGTKFKRWHKVVAGVLAVVLVLGASPVGRAVYAATASALGVWQTSNTFTITENGTYTVYARDAAGNISEGYTFTVSNIDNAPPTLSVGYSTTSWTNGDVSLVIDSVDQASPGGTAGTITLSVVGSDGTVYATDTLFTQNTSGTVTSTDDVGNAVSAPFEITWIDKTSPSVGVSADIEVPTNTDVVLTLNASDSQSGLATEMFSWDNTNWVSEPSKTFTENGTYVGYARDAVGNVNSVQYVIDNIDRRNPVINGFSFSTLDPINTEVVVTADAVDIGLGLHDSAYNFNGEGWQASANYTVTANGTYTLEIRDKAGNTAESTFVVSNLDFDAPVIHWATPNIIEQTNTDVTFDVGATDNEGGLGLADEPYRVKEVGSWQSSNQLVVSENGTYTIQVIDAAGNIASVVREVSNIDKTLPTISVVADTTDPANRDVVLTVTASDNVEIAKVLDKDGNELSGIGSVSNKTYEFSAPVNGTYSFVVVDTASNQNSVDIVVDNIDKDDPKVDSIVKNPEDPINTTVEVTVNASDVGIGLADKPFSFDGGEWTSSGVYVISTNGDYTVSVRDKAGNVISRDYSITNLDFDAPVINSVVQDIDTQTNTDVTLIVDASDVGLGLEANPYRLDSGSWQSSNQLVVSENGTYTVSVIDDAGNETQTMWVVGNIDKTLPTISLDVDTVDPVNRNVVVTVTAGDNVEVLKVVDNDGVALVGTGTATSMEYSDEIESNGTYRYTVHDTAGNTSYIDVTVSNIDKVNPTIVSIVKNPSDPINTEVEVVVAVTDEGLGLHDKPFSFDGAEWVSNNRVTLNANGTYSVSVRDKAGNVTTQSYEVSNLDFELPVINSVTQDISEPTNTDVVLSVDAVDVGLGLDIKPYRLDGGNWQESNEFTVEENGTYLIEVIDDAGNIQSTSITVTNIDKVLAVASHTVDIEPDVPTNTDVVITLTASDDVRIKSITLPDGVVKNIDDVTATLDFTATDIGVYTFKVEDTAGNITEYSVDVPNIDKQPADITVTPSVGGWTTSNYSLNVEYKDAFSLEEIWFEGRWYDLSSDELPDGAVVEKDGAKVKRVLLTVGVSENGTHEFKAIDYSGNSREVTYAISNIDREKPSMSFSMSPEGATNSDVTITVNASDNGDVSGIKLPDGTFVGGSTAEFVVSGNGDYTFTVVDGAGNEHSSSVSVLSIDKSAPEVSFDLSIKEGEWTSKAVIVTVNAQDSNTNFTYVISKDGATQTNETGVFELTENGTYTLEVTDGVGNKYTETFVIGNIDTEAPTMSVSVKNQYWVDNKNTLVVRSTDALSGVGGFSLDGVTWQSSNEFTVGYADSYTVYVKDSAGNISKLEVSFDLVVEPTPTPEVVTPTPTPEEPVVDVVIEDTDSNLLAKTDTLADGSLTIVPELVDMPVAAVQGNSGFGKFTKVVEDVVEVTVEVVKVVAPYAGVALALTLGVVAFILMTDGVRVYGRDKKNKWKYLGIARCRSGLTGYSVKVNTRVLKMVDGCDFKLVFGNKYSTAHKGADLTIKIGSQSVSSNIYKNAEFSITR